MNVVHKVHSYSCTARRVRLRDLWYTEHTARVGVLLKNTLMHTLRAARSCCSSAVVSALGALLVRRRVELLLHIEATAAQRVATCMHFFVLALRPNTHTQTHTHS